MSKSLRRSLSILFVCSFALMAAVSAFAQVDPRTGSRSKIGEITVGDPVRPTVSRPAHSLPEPVHNDGPRDINPRRTTPPVNVVTEADSPNWQDPLVKRQRMLPEAAPNAFTTPILNFNGLGFTGVNPPDTVGDVGPNHYVQSINGSSGSVVRIFDKTTGATIGSQFSMEALATAGNPCTGGAGDPIVLYDQMSDRWLLSEFSGSGNRLCVYISTTPDPAGTYFAYSFQAPSFPDYPKYGVWPDAYYVSSNEGTSNAVYALDRAKMLLGQAATFLRFSATRLSGFSFGAFTPADLDGSTTPPAGADGIFMRHRDTEIHGPAGQPSADILEIYQFHVDWTTPANSSFTQIPDVMTAETSHLLRKPSVTTTEALPIPELFNTEFNSTLCGQTSFFCMGMPGVAQGAGSSLDPLREVIMFRLAYRNFGTHQTLVGNFVTDVGSDIGGVRWFELRKVGAGGWTLHQEGTHSPTSTDNRWMGGIAMDSAGNIALAYNVSSQTLFPGIRYTGRLSSDTPGVMTQGDNILVAGTANNGSNRYGDYSAMSVDPSDDCTFWFTGQWNGASSWSTRIGKFKFDQCGTPDFTLSAAPQTQNVCVGTPAVYNVNVGSVASYNSPVTLTASGNPGSAAFGTNPVTPPGASTMTISGAAAGNYNFNLVGTAAGPNVKQFAVGLNVLAAAPAAAALTAPANLAVNVPLTPAFSWAAVAGAASYTIEVATDTGFTNIVASASGLTGTTWTSPGLLPNTTYYWRVRAVNACGTGLNSVTFRFSTVCTPSNTTAISIPDSGSGSPYPSTITVGGLSGTVAVKVNLIGMSHTFPGDIDILLVGPGGQAFVIMSDVGGGTDVVNVNLELSDAAASTLPGTITSGSYRPTNSDTTDTFGAPAPAGPYQNPAPAGAATFASVFGTSGATMNGTWSLYVVDDAGQDSGTIAGGWSLDFGSCPTGPTPTPTATPTSTPTATPTATPTNTPTATPTGTPVGGAGFEGDVTPRAAPDGVVNATDVTQQRRFATGLDTLNPAVNEGQRADCAPFATSGDGVVNSGDVVQGRRFATGLDPLTGAGGPNFSVPFPENNASVLDDIWAWFFGRELRVGASAHEGKTVTVPIEFAAGGDEMALGFTLEYDASVLSAPRVSLGEAAAKDSVLTVNANEAGRLGILIDSAEPMAASSAARTLLLVTFDVTGEAGSTAVDFTSSLAGRSASNAAGDAVVVRYIGGKVTIGN